MVIFKMKREKLMSILFTLFESCLAISIILTSDFILEAVLLIMLIVSAYSEGALRMLKRK